jgi:hypothetical protein
MKSLESKTNFQSLLLSDQDTLQEFSNLDELDLEVISHIKLTLGPKAGFG